MMAKNDNLLIQLVDVIGDHEDVEKAYGILNSQTASNSAFGRVIWKPRNAYEWQEWLNL